MAEGRLISRTTTLVVAKYCDPDGTGRELTRKAIIEHNPISEDKSLRFGKGFVIKLLDF